MTIITRAFRYYIQVRVIALTLYIYYTVHTCIFHASLQINNQIKTNRPSAQKRDHSVRIQNMNICVS